MADLIKLQLEENVAQNIVIILKQMEADLQPFFVPLTNKESTGIRSMADGREGEVRLLNQVALAHPDELRRKDDPLLLDKKLKYDILFEAIRQHLVTLLEMVTQTQLANSKDIMKVYDNFAQVLQVARKSNPSLDTAMQEIDNINKKFGRIKADNQDGGDDTPTPTKN